MEPLRIVCAVVIFVLSALASAHAEPIALQASLSLNFLDGKHDTGTGIDRLNFVPLPLADVDARYRHTTLHVEGLPAITFGYGSSAAGQQYTHLSIINVVLRQSSRAGYFVGAGQTIYNQQTFYPPSQGLGVESQASRVTGARFEAGLVRPVTSKATVECVFALNPFMRGLERTALRPAMPAGDLLNPERAVQVDIAVRLITQLGRGALITGVRYLNYASRYDSRAARENGLLADRNVGVMPLIGYRRRF